VLKRLPPNIERWLIYGGLPLGATLMGVTGLYAGAAIVVAVGMFAVWSAWPSLLGWLHGKGSPASAPSEIIPADGGSTGIKIRDSRNITMDNVHVAGFDHALDIDRSSDVAAKASTFSDRTIPRNAPCPCGSGKKYKKCHGKTASR
jgi:hypothetical protein